MEKSEHRSPQVVIAVLGGVFLIVAALIGLGLPLVDNLVNGKRAQVAVALANRDCRLADYYVDGEKVVASVAPTMTVAFKSTTGEHWVYSCVAGTTECTPATKIRWTETTSTTVAWSDKCRFTITAVNDDCTPAEFWVDGRQIVPAVAAGDKADFQVLLGAHRVRICYSPSSQVQICNAETQVTWTVPTSWVNPRSASCTTDLQIENLDCAVTEVYIDGKLLAPTIPAGSDAHYQVTYGRHRYQVCDVGKQNCSSESELSIVMPTRQQVNRRVQCDQK